MYTLLRNKARLLIISCVALIITGCASGPAKDISLVSRTTDAISSKDGLFVQETKKSITKPDCSGECPTLEINSLVFPGEPKLTELIDKALTAMTAIDDDRTLPYANLKEFESYYFDHAAPRDSVMLNAKTRYRTKYLTVIELSSGIYMTGAAHGMTAVQFINWDNNSESVITLESMLQPGKQRQFDAALNNAHAKWVEKNPDAQEDPDEWKRIWPYQPSDNVALTDMGLLVKYNSYEIAPYSSGQPEILIPYSQLKGIIKPEYLPR